MSLSAVEIAEVLAEVSRTWTGAQVQKVHMRGPSVVLLGLRAPGRSGVLRVSVEPPAASLCLRTARGPVDPEARPFCMLLRRLLGGRRLEALGQLGGDRVVEVRGPGGALVAEMTGRRGLLVALDHAGVVLAMSSSSPPREGLARGAPYHGPPPRGGDRPSASRLEPGRANEGVCALYGDPESEASRELDAARAAVRRALEARLGRLRRAEGKVRADLARAGDPEALSRVGELLKAAYPRLRRGMASVEVEDHGPDGAVSVTVELDPRLDPAGNLERCFARARKARRAVEAAGKRLAELAGQAERLGRLLEGLERAGPEELEQQAVELDIASGAPRPGRPRRPERQPYTRFRDARGRPILVGRSAADNDSLTLEVARPSDLWLHVRGGTGSHVVVPLDRRETIDPERLVDAATLAAHFSTARGEPRVEVTYTPRRFVRKGRGSPPGAVSVLRERVLLLELEPERLDRLLRGDRTGSG